MLAAVESLRVYSPEERAPLVRQRRRWTHRTLSIGGSCAKRMAVFSTATSTAGVVPGTCSATSPAFFLLHRGTTAPLYRGTTPSCSSCTSPRAAGTTSTAPTSPHQQVRFFGGRAGGMKRKRKSDVVKTPHQKTEFGKRMEFYWPPDVRRTRVPLVENSRQHLVYDTRFKTWMTTWYKDGIQVFKRHGGNRARSEGFERARMRALLLYKQLKIAGKLGKPKPDVTFSGLRGVIWDKVERAWVCRWGESGMQRWHVFPVNAENSFQEAYTNAVKMRLEVLQRHHQFVMQRNRWKNHKDFLGTNKT